MQQSKYFSLMPLGKVKLQLTEQIIEAIIYCEQFSDKAIVYYNMKSCEFGWKATDSETSEDELDLLTLDANLGYEDWDKTQESIPNDINALVHSWEVSHNCTVYGLVNEVLEDYRNTNTFSATSQSQSQKSRMPTTRLMAAYKLYANPAREEQIRSAIVSGVIFAEKKSWPVTVHMRKTASGVSWSFAPVGSGLSEKGESVCILPPSASCLSFGQIANIPTDESWHNEDFIVETWEQTYLTSVNYLTRLILCGFSVQLLNHRHLSGYLFDVMTRDRDRAIFKFSSLTNLQRANIVCRASKLAWNAFFDANALGDGYHIHTLYYPATDTLDNVIMQKTPFTHHRACIELFAAHAPKSKIIKMSRSKLINRIDSETGFFSLNYIIQLAMVLHDQGIPMSFDFSSPGLFVHY